MVLEVLHHGRKVPSLPLSKVMQVGDLADAEQAALRVVDGDLHEGVWPRRGAASGAVPAYLPFPWPRLYRHPFSECGVLLEREHEGENIVLGAKVCGPEQQSLADIDAYLERFRSVPSTTSATSASLTRLAGPPWLLRRFVFWNTLYLSGHKPANGSAPSPSPASAVSASNSIIQSRR